MPDLIQDSLKTCRSTLVGAAAFSLAINLLYLSYPIYMMQVYDRVLMSRNVTTLIMLTVATLLGLGALGALDAVRSRLLVRAGLRLDRQLAAPTFAAALRGHARGGGDGAQALRDLDEVRQLLGGASFRSIFDTPWIPIYLAILYLLHPLLGAVGLLGAMVVVGLIIANDYISRQPLRQATDFGARTHVLTEASVRNADSVEAMGMLPGLLDKWRGARSREVAAQQLANDRISLVSAAARTIRLVLQVAMLGCGAWLAAVERSITPGTIFIGAILLGRALMPIDMAMASWRPTVNGWRAWQRLKAAHAAVGPTVDRTALPAPHGALAVENVYYNPTGSRAPILHDIAFALAPGEMLGVIGRNAAGKTTLARLLAGIVDPTAGAIRLDGADLRQLDRTVVGRHVGYLPQQFELMPGTIAENIARFTAGSDEAVIAAGQAAGVHEMILRLDDGYDTPVGAGGITLSAGQAQRIALARALFGTPSLLILDEPNSNLDLEGEQALARALQDLKRRGATVVVIAHRPSVMHSADRLMVLKDGGIELLGARDEVIERTTPQRLRSVSATPGRPGGGAGE